MNTRPNIYFAMFALDSLHLPTFSDDQVMFAIGLRDGQIMHVTAKQSWDNMYILKESR